jgi:lipopolysaccharide/colanic/teichoic acid biosynthesis glycosyltransferase
LTRPNSSFYGQPISRGTGSERGSSSFESNRQHAVADAAFGDGSHSTMSFSERDTVLISDQYAPDLRSTTNPLTVVPGWLTIRTLPSQTNAYRFGKRIFDIVLGILILPAVLLLIALIAGIVWLNSAGPVFYRQTRIGQYGRKFKILKFRTMHHRSDKVLHDFLETHPEAHHEWLQTHKLREDPRITALGRFLRKTSLDELPQIVNVLRGEMSLVGPRPIVHAEREKYGDRFVFYTAVVPGITGLWQVSGRCDVAYDARVALDERYARNWNLFMDMAILCRTPRAVCRGRGAY